MTLHAGRVTALLTALAAFATGCGTTVTGAAEAQEAPDLAGTNWVVTGYDAGSAQLVPVLDETELTMAFGADGRVSGSAGCNRYTAAYTSEGAALSIGQAAATRRMCVTPEGAMRQEQRFLDALAKAATARLESDRLDLRTADGALAVTARRATR
jgi:heat shock protein HslJ